MTGIDEVVEGIALAHGYDPVKARAYYLRTRKLKGRLVKATKKESNDKRRPDLLNSTAQAERVIVAEKKIMRARTAAKKLPPKQRNLVMRKLIAAQKKLNKFKKPFKDKRETRTTRGPLTTKDFQRDQRGVLSERRRLTTKDFIRDKNGVLTSKRKNIKY